MHDPHYATPSVSCIHGSHAVDVTACRRRGISWYASHGMRSTLQWDYSSLECNANHVTWSDPQPSYVSLFRNLTSSLRARRAAGMGIVHYSTVVKTTAGCPLTVGRLYVQRSFWRCTQSTLHLMICVYGCADPAMLIIRIRLIFGSTIQPNTNNAFFHYSVPNKICIEYSVKP